MIYIVEDDAAVRESLKLLLEIHGHAVEAFESGDELFACGDLRRSACLILDINLPGDDGFAVLNNVRRRGSNTPVILVSGRANASMRAEALALGAFAFFDKPVSPDELLSTLARAIEKT